MIERDFLADPPVGGKDAEAAVEAKMTPEQYEAYREFMDGQTNGGRPMDDPYRDVTRDAAIEAAKKRAQRKPFWTRIARTRRHFYYAPANNLPGLILFGLLGVGGLAALSVGAWHLRSSARSWQDLILAIIGAGLVGLATAQIKKLRRQGAWKLGKGHLAAAFTYPCIC